MKVYAKVVGLSNHVEEEVVLDLGGVQVYGFLVCSPRELRLGEICMVLLEPSFIDAMDLRVEPSARTSSRRRVKPSHMKFQDLYQVISLLMNLLRFEMTIFMSCMDILRAVV